MTNRNRSFIRHVPGVLLLLTLTAGALGAQSPVPITAESEVVDSLAPEQTRAYVLDVPSGYFVMGEADQQTVDVVVTVTAPDGAQLLSVDGPAVGAERFQFETTAAGPHRIEVAPFEDGTGRFALRLRRVEPVAKDPAGRVAQRMAAFTGDDVPGGVVAVIRDGEIVFAEGYGMADLTHGVPFTTGTPTNIGSTSKQFTAFALLMLEQQGRLSLDDDIRTWIPELPDFGDTITIRHVLTHTSGYREFLNALALTGRRIDEGDYIDRDEIIALVQRQPELQNEPGAEWNYNNTGYALAAEVVARVTGQPFAEWMDEHIFDPLGMGNTVVRAEPGQVVPGRATGYLPSEDGWREAADIAGSAGAGGIYTTVADLARWVRNFESAELGEEGLFDRMTTRYVLTGGDTTGYGLGLNVDQYRGLRRVHHGGADLAHRSMLQYFPELDAAIVTLSNNATFGGSIANEVAEAFFEDAMEPAEDEAAAGPVAASAAFDPDSYDLDDFEGIAGRYAMEEMPSFVLTFEREGDELFTQATGQPRVRITPTSDSTFELVGVEAALTFHRDSDGVADSLTLHQNGAHRAHRLKEAAWEPDAGELEAFTGRYFSAELETFYTLALEDGTLVIRHRRLDDVELRPDGEPDTFTGGFPIAQARFERDDSGQVTALIVGSGRTRDVRFERVGALDSGEVDPAGR